MVELSTLKHFGIKFVTYDAWFEDIEWLELD